ncbi:hypothetical protein JL720_14888 [Aureococcus anophagefferens]|nr:hypothetical protein JL720_14888 [Aureococcus anophagefferens]
MEELFIGSTPYGGGSGLHITRGRTPKGLPPMRAGLLAGPLAIGRDALPSIIEAQRTRERSSRLRRKESALWEPRHRREKPKEDGYARLRHDKAAARARTAQPQRRPDRRKPAAARRAPRPAPARCRAAPRPPPPPPPPPRPPAELDAALGSYAEDPAFEDVPRLELGFGDDDDRSVCAFPSATRIFNSTSISPVDSHAGTFCTRDSLQDGDGAAPTLSRKSMGTRVWAGSFLLIQYMLHLRRPPRREATFLFEERGESPRLELGHAPLAGEAVVELGSGTAICGLVAHVLCGASKVVATDRDPVVCALARHNLAMNNGAAAGNPGRHVHVLDWHSKTDARTILGVHGARGFDTVIASDVLYDPKDLGPFFARAVSLMRRGAPRRRGRRGSSRAAARGASPRPASPRAAAAAPRAAPLTARDAGLVAESVDFLGTFFDPDLDIVDGDAGTPAFFSENGVAPGSGSWTSLRLFVFTPLRH